MPVSDDIDGMGEDRERRDLIVELNGMMLSEVATFESDGYSLPYGGPSKAPMASMTLSLDDEGNGIHVKMRAEDAESIAYDLLASAEAARELVNNE